MQTQTQNTKQKNTKQMSNAKNEYGTRMSMIEHGLTSPPTQYRL